jgi:hypothetical protein
MNKALVIVGSAVLAAAMATSVTTAEAGKHHGGGGFRIGGGHHFHHRHHHRRHIIVTPVYTERVVRKPVVQEKVVVVRYEDGMGRVYDLASKTWYDGASRCWSGKLAWTFKNGAWSYGSYGWSETSGNWRTSAPQAPAEVDCGTIPAFAGKFAPTVSQSSGQKEMIGSPDQGGQPKAAPKPLTPPVKTADKGSETPVNATGECKKYVPSLGEMLPVPCTN